jgi:hypothetical protein
MKKNFLYIFVLLSPLLFLTGCLDATSSPAPNTRVIPLKEFTPSKKNGVLYLIRNEEIAGGAIQSKFYIDDKYIGALGNESAYYIVELEPGNYTYKRVASDIFGEETITRKLRVNAGFRRMFIIFGNGGIEAPLDEPAYKNHKFLGYQKIGK